MPTSKKSKRSTRKSKPAKKKLAKKPASKKVASRAKAASKKTTGQKPLAKKVLSGKKVAGSKKRVRGKSQIVDTVTFEPAGLGARSAGQSGDLQGLSNAGRANSESVDELLEEGNSFEAEVVKGVEDAGDAEEGEVQTHEVPEDDVPGEYLDKD